MALLRSVYDAATINPYLAFESIKDMVRENLHGLGGVDPRKAVKKYIEAAGEGILKVIEQSVAPAAPVLRRYRGFSSRRSS